jgi:L-ribulokinase
MKKYTIGIDFGTLSGRAVLVRVADGAVMAESALAYPHGVMDETLPDGTPLPPKFALQHPQDYLDVLYTTLSDVIRQSGVSPEEIGGVGVDFTSCTVIPVKADGTPLCFLPEFKNEKHAYVKLWKHHGAQAQADRILSLAKERGETWPSLYGDRISSEWMFPKILEVLEEAPHVYEAADRFIEAGDWIVWMLTGHEARSASVSGFKSFWGETGCRLSEDFLTALHPGLAGIIGTKIPREVYQNGTSTGFVCESARKKTGLAPETAVAPTVLDAHVAFPALGLSKVGQMLLVIGTSGVNIVMADSEVSVPGICGVAPHGIMPGHFGYDSGQCAIGDIFDWFVKNCVPASYTDAAKAEGISIHAYLREKAARLRPGESGLLALDWWNGNRSVINDSSLSGMILGLTLRTKPEEIYRALLEACAYGTRKIIESFEECGVAVTELYACGGIAIKDPLMMQIYADVTGRPIRVAANTQAAAVGAAIFGASAAGLFPSLYDAAAVMGRVREDAYTPDSAARAAYDRLYREYEILHDYFGRGANEVMHRLREI